MGILPLAERLAKRALNRSGVHSRWVDTSVCRLHLYDAAGAGPLPTVVLLHGIGSSALPYAPVLQRLRRRARRVVAAEAPGHGWSAPPASALTPECLTTAMNELLDRELDEPAIVVGNSLGGAVAVNFALSSPDRVRALVLASPAGACMEQAELAALLGTFKLRSRAETRAFFARLYHRVPWFTPLVAGDVMRMFARETIVSFTSSTRCDHAFTPEQLGSLSMPILLIWGRSDRLMPSANLEYYRRHLPPHAEIEEPEGVGHCPHVDDPRRFAARIAAFAEGVLARGAGAAAPEAAVVPAASGVAGERAVPLEQGTGQAAT
ncbi:alpha/beta fold hydrolase [Sorangium sp. So ce1097]|uniref:alpha/beta fold hydrolase n=1 Tax=Sorangium sp. So ce1097 TaxID=3133330 RepID=UPI003F612636